MTKNDRMVWVDAIKAIALLWIVLNHVVERIFGYPYIANPSWDWPPLSARVAQLAPLAVDGAAGIAVNGLRYLGWFGDQGVQLFLIVSGFGLTWGLLAQDVDASRTLLSFYRRRAERIYPLWWGAHLFFVATWLLAGWGLSLIDLRLYLSLLGIRFTTDMLYYFSPAWWYVGLLIQLYLIYPLLWHGLQRWGAMHMLLVACLVGFTARAIGAILFETYLDAWLRGAVFVTRLPEFVFGMSLAKRFVSRPVQADTVLRKPLTLALAGVFYLCGTLLSLTFLGMAVAPFMTGVAAFVGLYALATQQIMHRQVCARRVTWLGGHTYSLYLMHHPFILALVPAGLAAGIPWTVGGICAALLLTVAAALLLEIAVARVHAMWRVLQAKQKTWVAAAWVAVVSVTLTALLVGAETAVRRFDPQEVDGWGERPSLAPHPVYGWHLRPSATTRLRWESYDYWVTANSWGFPGPDFSTEKAPDTLRIMTVGDAFTSAEGVDTDLSWPRQLETILMQMNPDLRVEVLNFAITGYGPNQYAAVIEDLTPQLRPDLIVLGFFVNDYLDVLWSEQDVLDSIGFTRTPYAGPASILRLTHLQKWIKLTVKEPLVEFVRKQPQPHGYFLSNLLVLERDQPLVVHDGRDLVAKQFVRIKQSTDDVGADLIILMIPASVQVCRPEQLPYFPRTVNLDDRTRYDMNQPQRITQSLAASLDVPVYDLRPVLRSTEARCPYQARNMHWTVAGHEATARYLAEILTKSHRLVKR